MILVQTFLVGVFSLDEVLELNREHAFCAVKPRSVLEINFGDSGARYVLHNFPNLTLPFVLTLCFGLIWSYQFGKLFLLFIFSFLHTCLP